MIWLVKHSKVGPKTNGRQENGYTCPHVACSCVNLLGLCASLSSSDKQLKLSPKLILKLNKVEHWLNCLKDKACIQYVYNGQYLILVFWFMYCPVFWPNRSINLKATAAKFTQTSATSQQLQPLGKDITNPYPLTSLKGQMAKGNHWAWKP